MKLFCTPQEYDAILRLHERCAVEALMDPMNFCIEVWTKGLAVITQTTVEDLREKGNAGPIELVTWTQPWPHERWVA